MADTTGIVAAGAVAAGGSKGDSEILTTARARLSSAISSYSESREDELDDLKFYAGSPGLYAAIHAKRERIAAGSGEKMRKPGTPGAPTAKAFKESAKTAKKGK